MPYGLFPEDYHNGSYEKVSAMRKKGENKIRILFSGSYNANIYASKRFVRTFNKMNRAVMISCLLERHTDTRLIGSVAELEGVLAGAYQMVLLW